MKYNISIIGGDLRNVKLAKMLANDENQLYLYGLEKTTELNECENITFCNSIKETVKNAEIVIGPIPF